MKHMALDYLPLGWPLVPCVGKTPRIKNWPDLASDDPRQVEAWLRQWPDTNFGVRCGRHSPDSGIIVIDVEDDRSIKWIGDTHGPILAPTCRTAKGWHLYVQYPVGVALLNQVTLDEARIELRGNKHLALLPPSKHPDFDHIYTWLPGYEPLSVEIPPAPAWVVEAMRKPPEPERKPYVPREGDDAKAALHWAADDLARRTCDRNNTLFRHTAWLCRDLGYRLDEVLPEMLPAYVASGKDEHGGRLTIQSAARGVSL